MKNTPKILLLWGAISACNDEYGLRPMGSGISTLTYMEDCVVPHTVEGYQFPDGNDEFGNTVWSFALEVFPDFSACAPVTITDVEARYEGRTYDVQIREANEYVSEAEVLKEVFDDLPGGNEFEFVLTTNVTLQGRHSISIWPYNVYEGMGYGAMAFNIGDCTFGPTDAGTYLCDVQETEVEWNYH